MKKSEFNHKKSELCAKEIIQYLIDNDLWGDINIYADGKCFCNKSPDGHYHYNSSWKDVYMYENEDPTNYMDYTSDFLTMSFEGDFYDVANYECGTKYCDKIMMGFLDICHKYGKYYELGNSWNLSLFDV